MMAETPSVFILITGGVSAKAMSLIDFRADTMCNQYLSLSPPYKDGLTPFPTNVVRFEVSELAHRFNC